jgi:hypothetical protein
VLPFWAGEWLGVFPTGETAVAQMLAGLFVIGSYFVAERVRKSRARPTPTPPPVTAGVEPNGSGSREQPPARVSDTDGGLPDAPRLDSLVLVCETRTPL